MKSKLSFLFLFLASTIFAQKFTIKSLEGNAGIDGVLVINKTGELVGKTDLNGEIQPTQNLTDDWYILNHQSIDNDTLFIKKIVNNEYKIKQIRETKIEEIIIKPSEKKFLVLEGYFNGFVTNNGEFNIFVDGIIQYVFDRKKNKLKNYTILEYRTFLLRGNKENSKDVSSLVFDGVLKMPNMKLLNNIEKEGLKKIYNPEKKQTIIEINDSALTEKEFRIFGYVFTEFKEDEIYNFEGTSIQPNRLTNYSKSYSLKLKHKSENEFSNILNVSNFYVSDIMFQNKDELEKGVSFNREKSNYTSDFWKDDRFNSMYLFLSKRFKSNFQEQAK